MRPSVNEGELKTTNSLIKHFIKDRREFPGALSLNVDKLFLKALIYVLYH